MKNIFSMLIVAVSLVSGGCATITGSEMQQLALSVKGASGAPIEGVQCALKNDKGAWEAAAPAFVNIRRSAEDLNVECKKSGEQDGLLKAISRASGGMVGNILFGGGIGALIDHNKGTGYNYPDSLPVEMGKTVLVDRRDQNTTQSQASPAPFPQASIAVQSSAASGAPPTGQATAQGAAQTNGQKPAPSEKISDSDAFMRSLHDNKGPARSY